jgi:hypothetical protein
MSREKQCEGKGEAEGYRSSGVATFKVGWAVAQPSFYFYF